MYISRYDINGKSIANRLYHAIENGTIMVQHETDAEPGKRLDHYAEQYYGDGKNWWIIAAASGIGWWFNLAAPVDENTPDVTESVRLYIPKLEDVIKIKNDEL